MMSGRKPASPTIDERVAKEIMRLHELYPKLGHHGLLQALREADVHVKAEELKRFLKEKGLQAQPSRRPRRLRGLPSWLGGPPEGKL